MKPDFVRLTSAALQSWDADDARRYAVGTKNGKPILTKDGKPVLPMRLMGTVAHFRVAQADDDGAVWVRCPGTNDFARLNAGDWDAL